jgi:transposase-like protein
MLSYTIGRASISVMIDGEFTTVPKDAPNYEALKVELQKPEGDRDVGLIKNLLTTKKMIEAFSYGRVQISEDEQVLYDGQQITNYLAARMVQILGEGYDVTPFARFMERVHANPADYTRDELYEWLEAADLPIMADGRFIAFKKVKKNYTDCHTGMFDNSVGQTLVMERTSCDPNRNNECSTGFHFCSAGYLSHFKGERVMVLAIDPADVTAIPKDYNRTKGRTCRYEVIGELDSQSEAYKAAWKRGVVEFDDDQELPNVKFESKPNSLRSKLKPLQTPDARDKVTMNGGKKVPTAAQEVKVGEARKPIATKVVKAPAPAAPADGELTFTTKDKRTISESMIRSAMQQTNGSMRGAAKVLSIQDSTLRGWLNKLPDVETRGPTAPTAATVVTPPAPAAPVLIFKTTDGREFTSQAVQDALTANGGSNRGAARTLGVGESTIRGWRSKGGF